MDFQEAMDYEPTRAEATRELEKHGATWGDFVAETGNEKPTGQDILNWLGY